MDGLRRGKLHSFECQWLHRTCERNKSVRITPNPLRARVYQSVVENAGKRFIQS